MTDQTHETITLYFKEGSSDKVYQASLEQSGEGWVVNFAYGRRGTTLQTGTKTQSPVDYAKAKKTYDKLIAEKTGKGYKPGEGGTQHTTADSRDTGIRVQLLNPIEETEAMALIYDDAWWAQPKKDGERRPIRKTGEEVIGINRKGQTVGLPQPIIDSARATRFDYLTDNEVIGDDLFAFDLPEVKGKDLRGVSYATRLRALESLGFSGAITVVPTARTTEEKLAMYNELKAAGAEGIVFKRHSAIVTAGRPNSGGDQRKFKFYNTASVVVTAINDKRSVAMAVVEGDKRVGVGNVTIPPNKDVPAVGSIVEVRYLYAYNGGSLYQPTFLQVRDDLDFDGCKMAQLKYVQ